MVFSFVPNWADGWIAAKGNSLGRKANVEITDTLDEYQSRGHKFQYISVGANSDWFIRTDQTVCHQGWRFGFSRVKKCLENVSRDLKDLESFVFMPNRTGYFAHFSSLDVWLDVPSPLEVRMKEFSNKGIKILAVGKGEAWVVVLDNGEMHWRGISGVMEKELNSSDQAIKHIALDLDVVDRFFIEYEDGTNCFSMPKAWHEPVQRILNKTDRSSYSKMQSFKLSIGYDNAGLSVDTKGTISTEDGCPRTKHWKIVSENPVDGTRIIELRNDFGKIRFSNKRVDCYPFITYRLVDYVGELSDFEKVLRHHPMRGGEYNACFNNCQHFVTIVLRFLQAIAQEDGSKSLTAHSDPKYYDKVRKMLEIGEGFMWNNPNIYFEAINLVPGGAYALGTAAVAASEATTTALATVPATGLAGFFGATSVEVVAVPAAYAGAAATAAAGLATVTVVGAVGSVAYWRLCRVWKGKTKFRDPVGDGFPTNYKPPLSAEEVF